ncbi:MAG TPA: SEL1-like repeat protein [Luteibacter sp.]|uniref:SEL1-like repeat protein n=1 Tax=Luteibacter sp. TaxID=1886636 RepID=UPI002C2E5082|nr:SEL1-like repeat protein [Luteibacter sp.]HVI55888.1 SEL1-like repeat protein [Luteibacter sp.]
MKHLRTAALALLCAATGAVSATDAASSSVAAKAELRKTIQGCAQGLERLLPGDYYFCAAARDLGHGHNAASRERLRDAAHWASKPAQYALGLMYFNGDEGPANRPLGLAWLAIADERHDPRFEGAFVQAYTQSTPAERAQANQYWLELKEDYSDAVAGQRARRRYTNEMRNIEAASLFGGSVFIDGITPPDGPGFGEFNNGESSRVSGSHGFAVNRSLNKAGEDFFRGMAGTVTVGEITPTNLVPIGQVAAQQQKTTD